MQLFVQAEDQAGYGFEYGGDEGDDPSADDDSDYGGRGSKRSKGRRRAGKKPAAAPHANGGAAPGDTAADAPDAAAPCDEITATGRRKRKDTGQARSASRAWSDDEERLFVEALGLHGRDWKACAAHVGSRDHRAIASHAQKFLIKALLRGEELPGKMADTGRGFTLSGKPLDPNSAAARAYGLRPESFTRKWSG